MKIFNSDQKVYTSFDEAREKLADVDSKAYTIYDGLYYIKDSEKRIKLKDFVFSGVVQEDETLSSTCQVCGYVGLRYLYEIVNHETRERIFPVGSECIKHFLDEAYDKTIKSPLFLANAFTAWATDVLERDPIPIFKDVVNSVYANRISPKQWGVLQESGYKTGIPLPYMLIRPSRRDINRLMKKPDTGRDWRSTALEFSKSNNLPTHYQLIKQCNLEKRYKMEVELIQNPPKQFRFYGVCYSTEIEKLAKVL